MSQVRDGLPVFFGWEQIHRKYPASVDPSAISLPAREDLVGEVHLFGAAADAGRGFSVSHQALCGFERPGRPAAGRVGRSQRVQPFGLKAVCGDCLRIAEVNWGEDAVGGAAAE